MMGGGATSWNSKRQPTIALSTTEAKYMASTQATKETIWMTKLMKELAYMKEKATLGLGVYNGVFLSNLSFSPFMVFECT